MFRCAPFLAIRKKSVSNPGIGLFNSNRDVFVIFLYYVIHFSSLIKIIIYIKIMSRIGTHPSKNHFWVQILDNSMETHPASAKAGILLLTEWMLNRPFLHRRHLRAGRKTNPGKSKGSMCPNVLYASLSPSVCKQVQSSWPENSCKKLRQSNIT